MLSGRGICDELITRPEESYLLWCVVVCYQETSRIGAPYIYIYIYIYDISSLRVKNRLFVCHDTALRDEVKNEIAFYIICIRRLSIPRISPVYNGIFVKCLISQFILKSFSPLLPTKTPYDALRRRLLRSLPPQTFIVRLLR